MPGSAVRFVNVSKQFRVGHTHGSLGALLSSLAGRLLTGVGNPWDAGTASRRSVFWALRDLDFAVAPGEAVGIIGPNGAGKSTVLKLLAGILRPDRGEIHVRGRLTALIEVGAGFHGDLTGRENIFLNGAILGMSRREIRAKLDAIVAFAGIERFLDTPVKRYSSGMYARLGFSIASHVDPDVLLVDEVLSVGDAAFRMRCMERMNQLVAGGTTLILVTHNLDQMQAICRRTLVLDQGRCVFGGPSRDAIAHYLQAMSRSNVTRPTDLIGSQDQQPMAVESVRLRFVDGAGDEQVAVRAKDPIRAEVTFRLRRPIQRLIVELNMRAPASDNLISLNSGRSGVTFDKGAGEHTVSVSLPELPVCGGQYFWNVRMWDADRTTTEVDEPYQFPLVIDDYGTATGALCLRHEWSDRAPPRPVGRVLQQVDMDRGQVGAFVPDQVDNREGQPR